MAATDYMPVPQLMRDDEPRPLGTIVMKFGGTSVGDAERLKRVARRCVAAKEAGSSVVAVGALGILLSLIFWSAWGGFGARDGAGRRTTVIEE